MPESDGTWGNPGHPSSGRRPRPHVELLAGWSALARLERGWREIHERAPLPVPCLAFEAVPSLRDSGLVRGLPAALLVHLAGALVGILPVEIHRSLLGVPIVRFLGAGLLDRHEPLLSPEAAGVDPLRVLAGLARALRRQPILDLGPLRPDGIGGPWLAAALRHRAGWTALPALNEYRVDLAGGWNRVRLSLPLPLREDAREGLARARRRAPTRVQLFRAREAGVVRELLSLGTGGRAPEPLAALLERGARRSRLVVGRLVHDGRPIAGLVAWVEGGHATLLVARDDGAHRHLHPRRTLLVALVRHLVEREACSRLLLPPARHDGRLGLVPRAQEHLVGTLRAGFARALAGLGLALGGGRRLVLPRGPYRLDGSPPARGPAFRSPARTLLARGWAARRLPAGVGSSPGRLPAPTEI